MLNKLITKVNNQRHYYQYLHPSKLESYFIVSTGRTGTQFFETFFEDINDGILSVHEPRPDLFDLGIEKHRNNKPFKETIKAIKKARIPFLRSYCHERTKTYVESNPFASFLLPEIQHVFKKTRFVIITRNADTYMKSAMNKSPLDDGSSYFYDDNDGRARIRASDFLEDPYFSTWLNFNRKQRIAWYWSKCNTLLLDFLEANPTVTLHLKFEDLFSKEATLRQQTVEQLLAFMNIELTPQSLQERLELMNTKKNKTQKLIYEGVKDWSLADKKQFDILTKDVQERINSK